MLQVYQFIKTTLHTLSLPICQIWRQKMVGVGLGGWRQNQHQVHTAHKNNSYHEISSVIHHALKGLEPKFK